MGAKQQLGILMTVGLGTLLSSMTNSVTNTVLPLMAHDFRLSMAVSSWINLIYLVVLIVLLLPAGRIADLVNRRMLMVLGFAVFGAASLGAGMSHSFVEVLVARGVSAMAGALLLATGPAVLTATFPRDRRGWALGWQALLTYLGLALGPIIGGWLAGRGGWPAVFWMVVPVSGIGAVMALAVISNQRERVRPRFDGQGAAAFMVAMVGFTVLINPSAYASWGLRAAIALLVLTILAGTVFIRRQQHVASPMMDLGLFRSKNYRFGTLGALLNYLCFFVALFLLPFFLTRVWHWSLSAEGLALTVMPALMMVLAPWAGSVSDRLGSRGLSTAGMLANAVGLMAFAVTTFVPSVVCLLLGLVSMGAGTGLFAAPNNAAIMKAAPPTKQGIAAGTLATARYVGMVAGTTLGSSAFTGIERVIPSPHPFLEAFRVVMAIGAGIGFLSSGVTLAMDKGTCCSESDAQSVSS